MGSTIAKAWCNKGITQFYLPPTHELYLPLLPSRRPVARVKFVYDGHRVKVEVTSAKKAEKPYLRSVKLPPTITASHEVCVFSMAAWGLGYCRSNGVTAIFVT